MKYLKNYNTFILESISSYSDENLTSLEGLGISEIVDYNFNCSINKLTNLKGGPKYVDGNFYCYNNKITTLKGGPIKVGGHFDCRYNNLKNLDYLPEIGGELICYRNNWVKPIPYNITIKHNLHHVYTDEQFNKFSSFDFQKEFLEREPENFMDLKPFGYASGLEELFPHLFDMDELGLLD